MKEVPFTAQLFSIVILSFLGTNPLFSGLVAAPGEAWSCSSLRIAEEENDEEEPPPPASRQNAILRAYFRKQYLDLRSERYDLNETFMERYVDRQIDSYLDDIDSRLEDLKYWLVQAEQAHEELINSTDPRTEKEGRVRLAKALKEVDDNAGGLRAKLVNIFLQLDGKEKLPIQITPADGYRQEMAFLREQVDEAEDRIRDYLFRATNTVLYQDLKSENMMIRLYWAEKIAGGIRDQLGRKRV